MDKIALGGGCHWCTEAVFQSLEGVRNVEQGFVASEGKDDAFSEAVIVHFNPELISLKDLIEIHLHTHKSDSNHSMRLKYRSAVYTFSKEQAGEAEAILAGLQSQFDKPLITKVYPFKRFKSSDEQFKNYYIKNPKKPFCENYIHPKLTLLLQQFSDKVNRERIGVIID
ncbi:MAG: peptide-methionine (S)-S-oxide reductase [Pricia sp.]